MSDQKTGLIQFLQQQAASLLLFQSVLEGRPGHSFLDLLQSLRSDSANPSSSLQAYGRWFSALAAEGLSWQDYLIRQILIADNPLTQHAQRLDGANLPLALVAAARQDLQALQSFFRCDSQQLSRWVQAAAALPDPPVAWELPYHPALLSDGQNLRQLAIWTKFETTEHWADLAEELAVHYHEFGSGVFATYRAFRWQTGQFRGVAHPDPVQLDELIGYEVQKATLIQNTEALLAGYPALHVLLYGSRGSGKSSLVKALLQHYGSQGLRLIEVSKADLGDLPTIVDRLREMPQKFIIFVDDLSFKDDDDAYKALKVVLEGNITARPQNLVVYATSNRRHLIREFFGDRPRPSDADEVHAWDTVQEKLSFSDRFGLTLTFEPADQTTYLEIIRHLAQQASIDLDPNQLEARALQWATRHNGRSGRTARQFIDFLLAEQRRQRIDLAKPPNLSHPT